MELFFRTSEKSDLQQELDRDQQASAAALAVDEPLVEQWPPDTRPLFGKLKKKGPPRALEIDPLRGWVEL